MWLLKTRTAADCLELVQKYDSLVPQYAILSHLWSQNPDEEVSFADVQSGEYRSKPGLLKIKVACAEAALRGIDYIWIDTCCIDKSSSAELTEAINSMYRYYECAEICFAYLADISSELANAGLLGYSRWWIRGWTLQELLAPKLILFFSGSWDFIGSNFDLALQISNLTRIDKCFLTKTKPIRMASVAKRMSWAAPRETTRGEDVAYCLMGLFAVNMHLVYGEGRERAFLRLQEEIMRSSDDHTLFAWVSCSGHARASGGMLAESPMNFLDVGQIEPFHDPLDLPIMNRTMDVQSPHMEKSYPAKPYAMTNFGLNIELPMIQRSDEILAILNCADYSTTPAQPCAIYLQRLKGNTNQFIRTRYSKMPRVKPDESRMAQPSQIYVPQTKFRPGPSRVR